jgi:hypothetical protein
LFYYVIEQSSYDVMNNELLLFPHKSFIIQPNRSIALGRWLGK